MNLLSFNFWFKLRPGLLLPLYQTIFTTLLIMMLVAAAVFFFLKKGQQEKIYNKLYSSLYSFFSINFFIGLVIWFFNYEMVPFLSARFWFLLWLISIIIWKAVIIKSFFGGLKRREEVEKIKELKKYMP